MLEEKIYTVDLEIAPSHRREILDFINENYLLPKREIFTSIFIRGNEENYKLIFKAQEPSNTGIVDAEIIPTDPLKLILRPEDNVSSDFITVIKEDIFFLVQLFEDNIRHSTLFFAWIEGEEVIPEQAPTARGKFSDRLFSSNLILLYVIFFMINITIFILLDIVFAIAAVIIFQLIIVLFSDKIYLIQNKWRITSQNPRVHILEYQLPINEFQEFQKKFGKNTVTQMKQKIYNKTLAVGKQPTCQLGEEIMESYGFQCNPQSRLEKVIDVYDIVIRASKAFDLPVPKIVISNTMIPNAAATGPSPKRGLVLITTGLLVQLEEDEILSVLGHEMGHLQGRDPLILFSIISGEFILRFTLFYPLVIINPIIYIIVVFAAIFFIAKFFETRADLLSAMKIGQPEILADALRKIGYTRLQMERVSKVRFPGWLSFDTHPPIYFRVERLESMKTTPQVKHPLLQSIKDVFSGFRRSFG
ncbi:MAG: M48 family metalloprotease [Methanobacterium sp.]|nr:M48 family metalloprotease [Methanobacterium sp.]